MATSQKTRRYPYQLIVCPYRFVSLTFAVPSGYVLTDTVLERQAIVCRVSKRGPKTFVQHLSAFLLIPLRVQYHPTPCG